jgi:enolase
LNSKTKKSNLAEIIKVTGTKTKDSRGNDALEVEVSLSGGIKEKVILPSKLSKDEEEEDNENERKAKEKGIDEAVSNVNDIIAPVIQGMGALNQIDIDKKLIELDGTKNKSKLGSNSTLAVSLAVAKTASVFLRIPLYRYIGGISAKILPVPCMNIINTNTGESTIDFKEYFIIPAGFKTYKEAHQAGQDIYNELKNVMKNHNYDNDDDDGFKPLFKEGNKEVFKLITEAVNNTQYKLGENIFLGLNIAASQLYDGNSYNLKYSGEGEKSTDEMIDYIEELVNEYPSIITIEDGLARNDWEGWQKLTERLGNKIQLVGYDLFVTNIEIIEKGIKEKVGNCVLINPNQVGTLSETLDAVRTAQTNNYTCMITHVEGEIEDGTIADLAVGTNSGLIRSGSVIRNDSMEAYKRLMKIEEELKKDALFLGIKSFQNYKI